MIHFWLKLPSFDSLIWLTNQYTKVSVWMGGWVEFCKHPLWIWSEYLFLCWWHSDLYCYLTRVKLFFQAELCCWCHPWFLLHHQTTHEWHSQALFQLFHSNFLLDACFISHIYHPEWIIFCFQAFQIPALPQYSSKNIYQKHKCMNISNQFSFTSEINYCFAFTVQHILCGLAFLYLYLYLFMFGS